MSVDLSRRAGTSHLRVGVTHAQYSLDPWGDPAAVRRGKRLLRRATTLQAQAIYGWGTTNPNPSPGVHRWRSLDRRIALIRSMGATPVITLCCAPDWMTARGTRTSRYPNLPPTRRHFDDFARLAKRIARRYPHVHHYLVWNEMKGFWSHSANNWRYRAYTAMYNRVWRALKAVNPRIRVGGPYLVIEGTGSRRLGRTGYATANPITGRDWRALRYWLRHKRGADFLAIDRKTVARSHDHGSYTRAQLLGLTHWFGSVVRQLRRETRLPVWFAEDSFVGSPSWRFQAAGLASILVHELRAGASASLRWGPQGEHGGRWRGNDQSLFSDTRTAGGGRPFPAYRVYRAIHAHFGPGTKLYRVRRSSHRVAALASRRWVLLINKRARAVAVRLHGRTVPLSGYGVRAVRVRSR